MMRWLVIASIKFRRILMVAAVGLIVFGVIQLDESKRDLLPEFQPVTVEVQTEALGLSASEVERLVTIPLEQDLLSGVAFLDKIESASLPSLSSVVMTFDEGTSLLDARQVVTERLSQAAGLPQVAEPPQMMQPVSSTGRVAMVSMASDELSPIETSVLARWVVMPRLLGVEGVANVSIWGFKDRQLQVLVDPERLIAQDVTLGEVIATAGNALEVSPLSFLEASSPGTGGFIDTVNQRLHVFHQQAISTPEELALVTVEDDEGGAVFFDGRPLALGEVAEIVEGHQPLIGDALCNGGPCILLVIEKLPGANTLAVTERIDTTLANISAGLPGIAIDSSLYRPADSITAATNNLGMVLGIGTLLLVVVLAFVFIDWRLVLIGILSVATPLAAAGIVLYLTGTTINALTLAGLVLALVLIVDESIVGTWTARESAESEIPAEQVTLFAANVTNKVISARSAALYAAALVAAGFVTFFFLNGEAGAFLPTIAGAYLLAGGAALITSLTLTPALSVLLLRNRPSTSDSGMGKRLSAAYGRRARSFVAQPAVAVGVVVLFVAAAALALPFLSRDFRPNLEERNVVIEVDAPAGTSLPRMDELAAQLVFDLGSVDGVTNITAHVGRAKLSDQAVNVNSAEVWATIAEDADYNLTLSAIEGVASAGEASVSVSTYSDQRVTDLLERNPEELVVRVYGENPAELRETAGRVDELVGGIAGVSQTRIDLPIDQPTIEVEIDLERAQALGLKPGDVRRRAATLVGGITVGNLFEEQKVFDVVVWGAPAIRQNVDDVRAIAIPTPTGEIVTLGDVADVRVVPNISIIQHESVSSYLDVFASVDGRSPADVAAAIDVAIAATPFPIEYHAEVLGGFAADRAGLSAVIAVVVASVITGYLLLQSAFVSWRLATMTFLALPLGVSGAIVALIVTGTELGLGSIAAIVALVGLGARGSILLIQKYLSQQRAGEPFTIEGVVRATKELLLPTVAPLVALAVIFLPLAVGGQRAGLEIVQPMAVAMLGGLVTTAVLTMFVIPALYAKWGHHAKRDTSAADLFEIDLREVPMAVD
ncbi:MAG: efflux RND transporter permease subunit [Acidimicrobiia bacterium]|nr:efflux RND transporter permease subunit [Acidimicrobiia bacterium]NND13073.1 efflux RND transporter permease subunit [Acidimicrobiia bacterium]NNL46992.1 efflux RND transporter permease subunit [Acidimicrobiia bacterium]